MSIVLDGTTGITATGALTGLTTPLTVAQGGTGLTLGVVLQAGGIDEYNANATLTSGNFGRLITSNTATATTLTLPLSATGATGSIMSFSNLNSGLLTITAAGSDIIFVNGGVLTTFTVPNGSSIQLAASGAGYWKTLTGMTGGLGVAQTWQNVTASRAITTTYYNTTGKPITVGIVFITSSGAGQFNINGLLVGSTQSSGAGIGAFVSGIVPTGGAYNLVQTGTITSISNWAELR